MIFRALLFFFFAAIAHADHFVTFIIPCYNCEPWIEDAISSIYEQNLRIPFEVICVDDGSTDSTYEILSDLKEELEELRIFRHETNQGGGATRNTCVSKSQGDLIFCLDSDNILVPNAVQTLIDYLDMTGSDVVSFGKVCYFAENLKPTGEVNYNAPNQQYRLQDLLRAADTPPFSGNYLYTRASYDRAGGYPARWGALDTFTFGFNQVLSGAKMTYVPGTFYWHRQGIDSYFTRESRKHQTSACFFEFMLEHKHLLTRKTVEAIHKQLKRLSKNKGFHDYAWFLENKKIELKP